MFHRVEQSPESKECQHLQQTLPGLPDRKAYAATGGANKPPTHQQLKAANHTPYRPNGCGVLPVCLYVPYFCLGPTGTSLPSTSRAFKYGVRFCRTVPKPSTAELNDGRTKNTGYGLGPAPGSGRVEDQGPGPFRSRGSTATPGTTVITRRASKALLGWSVPLDLGVEQDSVTESTANKSGSQETPSEDVFG